MGFGLKTTNQFGQLPKTHDIHHVITCESMLYETKIVHFEKIELKEDNQGSKAPTVMVFFFSVDSWWNFGSGWKL